MASSEQGIWKGICYDDGTGRNIYYVDSSGVKSRRMPENYVPEMFPVDEEDEEDNDPIFGCLSMRRYYFRNSCIRCKQTTPLIFISRSSSNKAFSLNYCAKCTVQVTPGINRITGNGNEIWRHNIDTPKSFLLNVKKTSQHPSLGKRLLQRSKEAQVYVKTDSKHRRNAERIDMIKNRAMDYGIVNGTHLSWGYSETFDEYYGGVNEQKQPSGRGVKFYSDGSTYIGNWLDGVHHTTAKGIWIRPGRFQYEGQWQKGQKHGRGVQTFPDGSIYTGEFAKGYEHGAGRKQYPDGSVFEGRFRFGKRDGPGVLTTNLGEVIKKNFKENDVYHEKPIPEVDELADTSGMTFNEPEPLIVLAIRALASTLRHHKQLIPIQLLYDRLPAYFKQPLALEYLQHQMHPPARQEFSTITASIAFTYTPQITFEGIKFTYFEVEALLLILSGNTALKTLKLVSNRIDYAALELISKTLDNTITWPVIESLDLSFNYIEMPALRNLIAALKKTPSLTKLKLSGCKIFANGAALLAEYLLPASDASTTSTNGSTITSTKPVQQLRCLDLSFNAIQTAGAQALADVIRFNRQLVEMNLRHNQIGAAGAEYLVDALQFNHTLHILCLADNKIGTEYATLLAARLKRASTAEVGASVLAKELVIPVIYREKKMVLREFGKKKTVAVDTSLLEKGGKEEEESSTNRN